MRAWLVLLLLAPTVMAAVSPQQSFEAPSGQQFGSLIEGRDGYALIGADPTAAFLGPAPNGPGGMWFYGADQTAWRRLIDFPLASCNSVLGTGLSSTWALGTDELIHAAPCEPGREPEGLEESAVNVVDPINQGRIHNWALGPLAQREDVTMPSDNADRVYFGESSAAGDGWWATTWETSELLRAAGSVQEEEVSYTHVGIYQGTERVWTQSKGPFTGGSSPPHFDVIGIDQDIRVTHPDGSQWGLDATDLSEVPWTLLPSGSGKDGMIASLSGKTVLITERGETGWSLTDTFTINHTQTPFAGAVDAQNGVVAVGLPAVERQECEGLAGDCTFFVDEPGHVLIYRRDQVGTWMLHEDVRGPGIYGDDFGAEVSVVGGQVLIGAPGTDPNRDMWGRAYVRTMNQWPTAGFTWPDDPAPYTFQNIRFSSISTDPEGAKLQHSWDFDGDGEEDATGTDVTWSWRRPGIHPVTLHVEDNQEGRDAITHLVFVQNRAPQTDFFPTPTPVWRTAQTLWENYAFDPDGNITSCAWDFGDGRTSDACEPELSYPSRGIYTVQLTACDDGDNQVPPQQVLCTQMVRDIPVFNHKPVIELAAPANVLSAVPFTVTASATDPDGTIVSQAWTDGASGNSRSFTAVRPGTFRIGYEATDDEGDRSIAWIDVPIDNRPPVADFRLPEQGSTRIPLTFADRATDPDGRIVTWQWNFGDGNQSADRAPRHSYAAKGIYEVSLSVMDDFGAWSPTHTKTFIVDNDAPVPRLEAAVDAGQITIEDASYDPDGTIVSRTWFLDGIAIEPELPWTLPLPAQPQHLLLQVEDDRGTRQNTTLILGAVPEVVPETTPEPNPEPQPTGTPVEAAVEAPKEGDPEPAAEVVQAGRPFPWFVLIVAFLIVTIAGVVTASRLRNSDS